ncbi:MAG: DUF1624 domain-containing protein [Candidatus Aenigmarchaeota archaeon]|nr:DUF1624 domain-containing protein [Candidatus Aenigmarchaeota archaeon]
MGKRFFEIDAARGAAIILMILYHAAFDLQYFGIYKLELGWIFWYFFPRLIASTFIVITGISLTLNYNKSKVDAKKRFVLRGLKIFCFGLLITAATYLFLPKGTIFFGILHFIGVSTIASIPFLRMREEALLPAAVVFLAGFYTGSLTTDSPWLLWLGLMPKDFYTFDYFPVFPWFGLVLTGIYLGNKFYPGGKRSFGIGEFSSGFLETLGRNSLLVYLLHQPAIILLLAFLR